MILLFVNFHYIGDENQYERGIYPASPERLDKQLDILGSLFHFVGGSDVLKALSGEEILPKRSCCITFDDGLRCQYETALPILDKKGIPALFFAPTAPYTDKKTLTVHKIHWLLSQLEPDAFEDIVLLHIQKAGLSYDTYRVQERARLKYRYDNKSTAAIKFILNCLLDEDTRQQIVNNVFLSIVSSEERHTSHLYMDNTQLSLLAKRNYLGVHGHDHIPLSNPRTLFQNIKKSKDTLERMTSEKL